jgi:hypothetical protein
MDMHRKSEQWIRYTEGNSSLLLVLVKVKRPLAWIRPWSLGLSATSQQYFLLEQTIH